MLRQAKKNSCEIVAEIGINHNGDLNIAKKLIKQMAVAECDCVKFQKRTVEKIYTKEELDKYRESPWGTTNREQKNGLEFGETEYNEIDIYTEEVGINWFVSPWDTSSVDFLQKYKHCMPYVKVASACIADFELLESIKSLHLPIVLSTGMSTKEEVDKAVDYLKEGLHYILACTSTYPTSAEEMNLSFITTLKKEYPRYKIGFSNHYPGVLFLAEAVLLGAEMVEFHVTLSRAMYGSDQPASIELPGVLKIVDYIRDTEKAAGTGEWTVFPSEEKIKQKLRR